MLERAVNPVTPEPSPNLQGGPEIPPLILELLAGRGLDSPEKIQSWVYPSLQKIRGPHVLKDMDLASDRLLRARWDGEVVAVYGDYDLDGTSGVALLDRALRDLGFKKVVHHQPLRLKEGYGLHPEACRALVMDKGASLILTVDVGITGHSAALACRELGVDLIVTDHHLAEKGRPDALAVINPNQEDCPSGLGHLCGTGVAFYLCLALLSKLRKEDPSLKANPKDWLDVFTIATITDMVPLVAENRVLVKHGLMALKNTNRVALTELLSELNLLDGPLSSQDVAMRFAPKLNALSRLEGELRPLDLYLEVDPLKSFELVQRVLILNEERRSLQKAAEDLALKQCEAQTAQKFLWCYDPKIHPGVLGLVATKMAQTLTKPSFVGSVSSCGKYIVGSARRPEGFEHLNLVEILASAQELLIKFGGHAPAAGFELLAENANGFFEALNRHFATVEEIDKSLPTKWDYDLEVDLPELNRDLMTWLEHLEPFGVGFPVPLFKLCDVEVAQVKILKGQHLRLKFLSGVQTLAGIWFSPGGDNMKKWSEGHFRNVNALGELSLNRFRGEEHLQFMVRDLETVK